MTDVAPIETGNTTEPRISYAVARLERAVRSGIAERVRPYGLTTLQYTTLSVLNRHGAPLSNAQLARRAYMTPQAMSEVIDALETKGLIRRNPHPNHGRLLPATLTAKGRRVLADCERGVDEMEDSDARRPDRPRASRVPQGAEVPRCAHSAPASRTTSDEPARARRPRPGDGYADETRASAGVTLGCLWGSAILRTDSRWRTGIGMR